MPTSESSGFYYPGRALPRLIAVLLEALEPPAEGWVKVRHRDGQLGYIRTAHLWGS